MRTLLTTCALLALASCHKPQQSQANEGTTMSPEVPGKGVDRSHKGAAAPNVVIYYAGHPAENFADAGGQATLVNLWATWCAPCVKELPTLSRLAKAHENDRTFAIWAISQDDASPQSVEAFLKEKAPNLEAYQDPKMALSGKLGAEVLPTSILYDAKGREVWRYVGDQDWTSAAAAKLLAEGGVSTPK